MQLFIMGFVGGLVAEQIAVGSGIEHGLVICPGVFTQRQGNGAVRVAGLDLPDQLADLINRYNAFPALQHKGAKAKVPAFLTALQDLFPGKLVAVTVCVGLSDAAVDAVIPAVVSDFNESADIDIGAVDLFFVRQGVTLRQKVDEVKKVRHPITLE